jgi:hypothetical protein
MMSSFCVAPSMVSTRLFLLVNVLLKSFCLTCSTEKKWQWGGGRHKGRGRSHYAWREGDDGGDGPWFVCEFVCVWRDHEK